MLESIEISFRTYIAYTLAIKHGSTGYLNKQCFKKEKYFKSFIKKLEDEKNSDKNNAINARQVFTYILAIKHLIADKNIWNDYFIKLQALFYKYDNYVELELLGFHKNWVSILSL